MQFQHLPGYILFSNLNVVGLITYIHLISLAGRWVRPLQILRWRWPNPVHHATPRAAHELAESLDQSVSLGSCHRALFNFGLGRGNGLTPHRTMRFRDQLGPSRSPPEISYGAPFLHDVSAKGFTFCSYSWLSLGAEWLESLYTKHGKAT